MKNIILVGLLASLASACGTPPSRPESLWDSIPGPETGVATGTETATEPAKSTPAKVWEGEPPEVPPEASPETSEDVKPEVAGTVVLNEVYYDAVGSDTDGALFIELYGTPALSLGRFVVNFVDGGDGSVDDSITLPEDAILPEDGFYVIADTKTGSPTGTNVLDADFIDNFDPQNGPDAVQLQDDEGNLLDAVGYGTEIVPQAENGLATFMGSPAMDVVNGHSLERAEPGIDTFDNAIDFVDREIPTPGR